MEGIFAILNTDLLVATIRLSTPITLAAVGATICEKSGIVNIAMEGMMIMGAFFAVIIAYYTGNPWLGLIGGVAAGGIFSLIHAVATVTFHLDHVVSGAVLNILSFGIVRYLMVLFFGHPGTTEPIARGLGSYQFAIPGLSKIPILGPMFFNQTPIIYMSFILIAGALFFLKKTKVGLHLRAAGEHPLALETIGVSVYKMRYLGVVISGLFSGLAGAYLSIENAVSFTEGMSNGRGFIALAAMISGGWTALGSFFAALFFGFADAFQIRMQIFKVLPIPAEIFIIFPYIATVIAVAGLVKKSRPPKADGIDFMIEREDG